MPDDDSPPESLMLPLELVPESEPGPELDVTSPVVPELVVGSTVVPDMRPVSVLVPVVRLTPVLEGRPDAVKSSVPVGVVPLELAAAEGWTESGG